MSQPPLESNNENSVAASHQSQNHSTNQNPPSRLTAAQEATVQRLMEEGVPDSIAIGCIGPTYVITDEQREEFARGPLGPLPDDDDDDDFADEPASKPYDPADSMYEWSKPGAWIEEKDSEGRTIWRNRITGTKLTTRPWGFLDPNESQTTTEQDKDGPSSKVGSLEHPDQK